MIPTKQDLDSLFSIYDVDGSGSIEYKEFTAKILNKEVQAGS
jgi:Ca2+-binding EF-hand superfamily protein